MEANFLSPVHPATHLPTRQSVADLIGADPREIIFTSGATESNNMAVKGVANFYRDRKKHIITVQTVRGRASHPLSVLLLRSRLPLPAPVPNSGAQVRPRLVPHPAAEWL
jgi:hypothetical protein